MSDEETEERAPTFYVDFIKGPTVSIYVGPSKIRFDPHKALLCNASSYFDKCLNGGFREGVEQSITLDDVDIEAFSLLLEYLYTGQISLHRVCDCDTRTHSHGLCKYRSQSREDFERLIRMVMLTDRFMVSAGPAIEKTMKELTMFDVLNVTEDHILEIAKLPVYHHARKTLIQIFFLRLLSRNGVVNDNTARSAPENNLLDMLETPEFAPELSSELMRPYKVGEMPDKISDPLTEKLERWKGFRIY